MIQNKTMKGTRIIFGLLFLVFGGSSAGGQVLDYSNGAQAKDIKFEISGLPALAPDLIKYGNDPYFQAFIIYGDGNFRKIDSLKNPMGNVYEYDYAYRDLDINYPAAIILNTRKDADEPPDAIPPVLPDQLLLYPNKSTSQGPTSVEINGTTNPNPQAPIYSKSESDLQNQPLVPMIKHEQDWLKMGISNYSDQIDAYFLDKDRLHVFPIAYRSVGSGILFFFYQDSNPRESFEYYNTIPLRQNSGGVIEAGTFLPNYRYSSNPPNQFSDELLTRMKLVNNYPVGDAFFNDKDFNLSSDKVYDNCLVQYIPNYESSLLANGVLVTLNEDETESKGELRSFPILKMPSNFIYKDTDATFLAVLYDSRQNVNTSALDSLNTLIFNNPNSQAAFPDSFEMIIDPEKPDRTRDIKFADYFQISALKGEPDDPGGLTVKSICKCCDDFIITFDLEFCNSPTAENNAIEANIFLESFQDGNSTPLFSEFQLLSTCVDGASSFLAPNDCITISSSGQPTSPTILNPDVTYHYDFRPKDEPIKYPIGLIPSQCGKIQFSAKIKGAEIGRLIREPVMRYCVKFQAGPDVGEYCMYNNVLQDSICYKGGEEVDLAVNNQATNCIINPIWEEKIEPCEAPIFSNHHCATCKKKFGGLILTAVAMLAVFCVFLSSR